MHVTRCRTVEHCPSRVSNSESGRDAPPELAPGQYVVLKVSDTGTGMDAATLARATEPFFTTKDPGKGTGLGLAMMQGVVAQSGGATRLRSTPGAGTDVEVWLQRTRLPSAASSGHDQTYSPPRTGETILVCDDDPTVLEFLSDALKGAGYHVVAVHDGRSVLPALKADSSIRLLVVDFAMPEMNGAAVIRQVLSTSTGPANPDDHGQYRTRCGPGRDPSRAHIVQAVPSGAARRAHWGVAAANLLGGLVSGPAPNQRLQLRPGRPFFSWERRPQDTDQRQAIAEGAPGQADPTSASWRLQERRCAASAGDDARGPGRWRATGNGAMISPTGGRYRWRRVS